MKTLLGDILVSVCMGMVIPGIIVNFCGSLGAGTEEEPLSAGVRQEAPLPQIRLPVLVRHKDGGLRQMDMDSYVEGVVLAEMPASFEPEALKAQAVVARTYARKAWVTGGKHEDGSVCTDAGCCQGYREAEDHRNAGGTEADIRKVRLAVEETSGQVLVYGGELIEATYFSCSGGRTEDALAVWGRDYPYLQAVDSPGEEQAAHYTDTLTFTARQVEQALQITLGEDPDRWIGEIRLTEGGGVDTLRLGEQTFRGTQIRSALSLPSAAFTVRQEGDRLIFSTRGYGHRVGMSQYGADAMALEGSSCRQILAHYYPGAELVRLDSESFG